MSQIVKVQNIFGYGELGDRLDGVRNSEVYSQGAREIENMIITDIGSLKVARQYDQKQLFTGERTLDCKGTALGYYIILTDQSIKEVRSSDDVVMRSISHGLGANTKMNFIGNDKLVLFNGTSNFRCYSIGANITEDNHTFSRIKYPIKERETLQLDLWKVTKNPIYTGDTQKDPPGTKPLRITQMSAFTDPLIKTSGGVIYLHNSDIRIDRIYTSYNAIVDINYFTNPVEGQIYGIMRNFPKVEDGKGFIVEDTPVAIGEQTHDAVYKGNYFTSISGDGEGTFTFGKLINNLRTATHIDFFQDRMFIYKDSYFYVSKIGEYNDFRNGLTSDSPFFFQLNPIAGKASSLIATISDIGLFVLTTGGVYVIGYGGSQLTPTTFGQSIVVASDIGTTDQYCIKDNILYFLNQQGILKAVSMDRLSQQVAFNTITVDKYTNKKLFSGVTKLTIDDRDYVACKSSDNQYLYIIEPIETGSIFRKVRLKLDLSAYNKIIGLDEKIITDGNIYNPSTRNYQSARILTLVPDLSNTSGMFLFDNSSKFEDIVVKMLNEDRQAVLGVKIDKKPITNLPQTVQDRFSIYRERCRKDIYNGIDVEIITNQNDKVVELQGIETVINVIKDR